MAEEKKIRVGIVGGAGYTAGELIRILLYHPAAVLKYIQSSSNNGQPVSSIHTDLLGETEMVFSDIRFEDTDILFCALAMVNRLNIFIIQMSPSGLRLLT